jgi:hypothetical protein
MDSCIATTAADTCMNTSNTEERLLPLVHAEACIDQLTHSERGMKTLVSLSCLLWENHTWSLDYRNQSAITELLKLSLDNPSVRELVQHRAKGAHRQLHLEME